MSDKELQIILKTCLDKFEEHEITMLAWGDTGSFFNKNEVNQLISDVLDKFPEQRFKYDIDTIFLELIDQAILIEVPHPDKANQSSGFYRTRMAESVHLFKQQRQLFWGQKIEASKTLVSDFRFVRRPRSYPRRDIDPITIKQEFAQSEFKRFVPILDNLLKEQFYLSGFQSRSLNRILEEYYKQQNRQSFTLSGSIVCAGTGSGKTMSFYLPGLTALVDHLCQNSQPGVRILAIYPRRELLKDQFYETWKQCRDLDKYTQAKLKRKLRIGTLFGDTPDSIKIEIKNRGKKKSTENYDLLHCTTPKCPGKMQWRLSDVEKGIERLCCSQCNFTVAEDEILLTREAQIQTPPDILFTTTEMLNQQLVNPRFQHLFGIGHKAQKPIMVLMDEVHTYEGTTGAQTAYLLRRWLQISQANPHFVGLSATLSDASNFFATLIGAQKNQVVLLEPSHDEMIDEGAEYILLLRGDPVSQSALLSTTIQTSMLTRRILDNQQKVSKGIWGTKTFIFTDDLDINNRLFHALVDAEGWKLNNGKLEPNPKKKGPLAALRANHDIEEVRKRKQISFGQDWRIATQIGHTLEHHDRAKVSRTSSQDGGVDSQAEVVVATASLEVGFNDPEVGAVIQHKAPRGVASFLQRKGRAGRSRDMRPWLIVVLSEFGRDRYMFQRYEELINPHVKRRTLPLDNRHIQKMQAAMALLDWLSRELKVSIWNLFKYPHSNGKPKYILNSVIQKVENLIDDQSEFNKFQLYLKKALKLDDLVVQELLWESPRSLMLSVIPSILRQLKTNWRVNNQEWAGVPHGRSPLPEFIPEALFADLNVPDVDISLVRGDFIQWESLDFYQGVREFAPGRLSKRYAIKMDKCDWLIPKGFNPKNVFDGDYYFEMDEAFGNDLYEEGTVTFDGETLHIYRPKQIYTQVLDYKFNLKDKSNASIKWLVNFYDESLRIEQPPKGVWSQYLKEIKFCLHKHATPVEVTRYSVVTKASIDLKSGDKRNIDFIWKKNGKTAAIGARQWVDGICLSFNIHAEDIQNILQDTNVQKSMRILLFKRRLNQCNLFNSSFTANWVFECYMAALAVQIVELQDENESIIHQAVNFLSHPKGQELLKKIPLSLFHSDVENDDEEQALQKELIDLFDSNNVLAALIQSATALWQDIDILDDMIPLAREVTENTLAAACSQTLFTLLNDADDRSILVDIERQEHGINIWLTEAEQGGCGIIANLADIYVEDPRRVLNVFMRHLREGEHEQIDHQLHQLLLKVQESPELQHHFSQVRYAEDHQQRKEANIALQAFLLKEGFILQQSFLNLLYSRILRPGSHPESDLELLQLFEQWQTLEEKTGLEWALNLFTHTAAYQKSYSKKEEEIFDLHCNYQGILWPRGQIVRSAELSFYNPFNLNNITERLLLKSLFSEKVVKISANSDYLKELHSVIVEKGMVDLFVPKHSSWSAAKIMMHLQEQHLDYYGLWLYPRIIGLYYDPEGVILRVELAEAVQ
ncbi:protein DpdJ [Acinetobacter baumannii]